MRIFKRTAAFILLNVLLLGFLNLGLIKPSLLDCLLEEFHAGEYSAVVLGQSHAEMGINPLMLSDEEEQAYNFGRRVMPFPELYYLLQELNKEDKVKTVYLELDSAYWDNEYIGNIPRAWDVNLFYHLSMPVKL